MGGNLNPIDTLHRAVGGATKKVLGIDTPEASAPPDPADAEAKATAAAKEKNKMRRMAIGSRGFQSTVANKGGYGGMDNAGKPQPTIGSPEPPKPAKIGAVGIKAAPVKTAISPIGEGRDAWEQKQNKRELTGRDAWEAQNNKRKNPKDMYRP